MSEASPSFLDYIYAPSEEETSANLVANTLQGRWDEVVKMCEANYELIHKEKINDSNDTVLHAAVDYGKEMIVAQLVNVIVSHEESEKEAEEEQDQVIVHEDEKKSALATPNARGDTPLHIAASRGFAYMCYCIIGANNERADLLKVDNEKGEGPLFLAALNGHKDAFLFLLNCLDYSGAGYFYGGHFYRNDGDTILHCAIRREYFDLAIIITHSCSFLVGCTNLKGETPLKLLATRPLAFRSGTKLRWWNELLHRWASVQQVDVKTETATKLTTKPTMKADGSDPNHKSDPENYDTCLHFIWPKIAAFFGESAGDTENPNSKQKKEDKEGRYLPPNYATISECLKSAYTLAAGFSRLDLLGVRRMKEKHVWSAQLLHLLMKDPPGAYFGRGMEPYRLGQSNLDFFTIDQKSNTNAPGQKDNKNNSQDRKENKDNSEDKSKKEDNVEDKIDMKDSALLIAARNGILEMVDKILQELPIDILYTTSKSKRNIVLAAVESRQPLVVESLRNHELWDNLILGVDTEENTALHLAAQQSKHSRAWQIPGHAMQMLWDIKWYEYVKGLVPHHFHLRNNQKSKSPPEIFEEEHRDLVKESSEWLKDTSESCSVVAALIAGVAFATSNAVPGGNNEETGKPNYEGQPAFNLFAIASLVALCFSVTALIMFLAILTSRKMAKDFRKDLPSKLVLGLSSLFISIASMLVSFCAAHFFVVKDKFKGILFPIYAATCLPVSFYAIAQFPLYVDLLRAILTKVPQPGDKGSDL